MHILLFFGFFNLFIIYLTASRGCISYNGKCVQECPTGTYLYAPGCNYLTREATCEAPFPKPNKRGKICDYSACYCEPPTVKNKDKCVELEDCPEVTTCPPGTCKYSVKCDTISPEPTCTDPCPGEDQVYGVVSNYTACYCSPPTVRNEDTGECVDLKDCPDLSENAE